MTVIGLNGSVNRVDPNTTFILLGMLNKLALYEKPMVYHIQFKTVK